MEIKKTSFKHLDIGVIEAFKNFSKAAVQSHKAMSGFGGGIGKFTYDFAQGYGWDEDCEEGWLEISRKEEL